MILLNKAEAETQMQKMYSYQEGKGVEVGKNWEVGININTLLCIKEEGEEEGDRE